MTKRALWRFAVVILSLVIVGGVTVAQEEITNARVVEMAKLGLDDDIIAAKIKSGRCAFQLADSDLLDLKKAGVSSKVIAAMLDASAITSPKIAIEGKPLELHTLAQAKVGGRLANMMTAGIKSVKWKAYLQGARATVSVGPTASLAIELPKDHSVDDFLLLALDQKEDRREIEVASSGGMVGAKSGVKAEAIIKLTATPLGGNRFKLVPEGLKKGEYLLYVVGSADTTKGLYGKGYDFGVQ